MHIEKEGVLVLILMSLINIVDYFHRYILSATKDLIKKDLKLSDLQTGIVYTSFIICYMIVSPIIGVLAEKYTFKRKYIIVFGVFMWSVATSVTALCNNFYTLLIPRVLFGFGEAIYGTIGPALLSDFFIPSQRNVVMSIFYAATPIGCALSYVVSGVMGQHIGWRLTCAWLGLLGIIAIPLLFIREPKVGEKDTIETKNLIDHGVFKTHNTLANKPYIFAVAGYVAVTFGMGGFSDWLPTFFYRYHNMSIEYAGMVNGGIVVIGGLLGALLGGFVNEVIDKRLLRTFDKIYTTNNLVMKESIKRHACFLTSSISMLISTMLACLALFYFQNEIIVVLILFGFATFFGWWYNGPINGIIQNCVDAKLRVLSNGMCVLFIHLFGDAISPSIIGGISDVTNGNLRISLILVPISFLISSIIWFVGWIVSSASTITVCEYDDKDINKSLNDISQ